jgi:hypothetical protein
MRNVLEDLVDRLAQHDPALCGNAPRWLVGYVEETTRRFLTEHPESLSVDEVTAFLRGGIHYISDGTTVEGEAFLESLGRIIDLLDSSVPAQKLVPDQAEAKPANEQGSAGE